MTKAETYLDVAALIDDLVLSWRKDAEDAARGTLRSPHDSRYARYADGGVVIARHLRKLADEITPKQGKQTG